MTTTVILKGITQDQITWLNNGLHRYIVYYQRSIEDTDELVDFKMSIAKELWQKFTKKLVRLDPPKKNKLVFHLHQAKVLLDAILQYENHEKNHTIYKIKESIDQQLK